MANLTALDIIGGIAAAKAFIDPTRADNSKASGKLSNFLAEIRQSALARTNFFEVIITPPRILANDPAAKVIHLYGCDASLPGIYLQTLENKRFGVGPNEKLPYSTQFNDIGITFYGDGQGTIYKFFYKWMHGIVRGDSHMISNGVSGQGLSPYEVEFKEKYRSDIIIRTFDEQQKDVLIYRLIEAYPIWISDTPLSWSSSDDIQRFPLAFTFLQARLDNVEQDRLRNESGARQLTPFEKLYKIGTATQTVFGTRRPQSIGDVINVVSNAKIILEGMKGVI